MTLYNNEVPLRLVLVETRITGLIEHCQKVQQQQNLTS